VPIAHIAKCLNCGIKHEWLFESLTLQELRIMKKLTGMTQKDFREASNEDDPEALAFLLYILHRRDKINIAFEDIDLDFNDFDMELTEAEQAQVDAAIAEAAKQASTGRPKKSKSGLTSMAE